MEFKFRISRPDAIAIANRGGDYPVHAAREVKSNSKNDRYRFRTACGRLMPGSVNHHPDDSTRVSCVACRRVVEPALIRERLEQLIAAAEPFIEFIDRFDRNPLNTPDAFYAIHMGPDDGASLRLSDLRRMRSLVRMPL